MALRITQQTVETPVNGSATCNNRITQQALEVICTIVLAPPPSPLLVTQQALEVLIPNSHLRVTQQVIEVIIVPEIIMGDCVPSATTELDIVNMALIELGQEPVTNLTTQTNKGVRIATAQYAYVRDEVLRAHPWNCASKREICVADTSAITGAAAGNPVTITSAGHPWKNGDCITIAGIVGMTQLNGGPYKIANVSSSTFELRNLDGTSLNGTAFTAYASGGTATRSVPWGFSVAYELPCDFIRLAYPEKLASQYRIEGRRILSSGGAPAIDYIYQLKDVAIMDQLLVSAIAARLAVQIALPITGSTQIKAQMEQLYASRMAEARFADSREAPIEAIDNYTWVDSRVIGTTERDKFNTTAP
jgi:hypothetical protein